MTYRQLRTPSVVRSALRLLPARPELPWELRLHNKLVYWREALRGAPLPPTTMMALVQGNQEADYFVAGGRRALETILETLEKSYVPLGQFRAVLDFGCGCGRVLRHWRPYAGGRALHGCDYNPELVAWARRVAPFATIAQNRLKPPLPYSDNSFDLIYAFSTFTHWDVALQGRWMDEFQRVLRPNGYLLFTTHGDYYVARLPKDLQAIYRRGEAVGPSLGPSVVGTNQYAAFNPYEQVRDELLRDMELVEFYRRASRGTPWQDVYLARKPTA